MSTTSPRKRRMAILAAALMALFLVPAPSFATTTLAQGDSRQGQLPPAMLFAGTTDTVMIAAAAGPELRGYAVGDFVPWEVLASNGHGEPQAATSARPQSHDAMSDSLAAPADGDWGTTAWPSDVYNVLETWYDKNGRYVLERTGQHTGQASNAFGWRHAHYDHNMNTNAIKQTTQKYFSYKLYQAYRYNYRAVLIHLSCTNTQGCWIIDELTSRVSMDRSTYGSSIFGLVTAFCEGYTRCPSWVHTVK